MRSLISVSLVLCFAIMAKAQQVNTIPPDPPPNQVIEVDGNAKTVIVKPQTPRHKYGYARHGNPDWGGRGYDHRGDYGHASTSAEGYLSGLGRLCRGQARFLEGLGRYQNLHQEARTKAIENWSFKVETWQYLKGRYRERKYGEDYLDKETHRLNQAERRYDLNQRKQALIQKGVLPASKAQSITIRGYKYKVYKDWKKTADHVLHRLEVAEKNLIRKESLNPQEQDALVDIRAKRKMVKEFISIKGNVIVDPTGGE